MSENNNHIKYTAADIEKYWKGQLSATEQHALEKAALDDPFLADAMEGYEQAAGAPQPVIAADNAELKKRLAERIAEKQTTKLIDFAWWKIAAAVIVLLGAGWLYTAVNNKSAQNSVAKLEKQKQPASTVPKADSIALNPGIGVNTDTMHDLAINKQTKVSRDKKAFAPGEKEEAPTAANATPPSAQPALSTTADQSITRADSIAADKDDVAKLAESKKAGDKFTHAELNKKTQGITTEDYKANNNALSGRSKNFSNTFNGYVLDQSNKPVANAFMQISNLNVNTKTDKQGFFSFYAEDTALSVSVASAGFETQNIHLRNKAVLNQIVLKPADRNLQEVVVQSNGAEKRKQAAGSDISIKILDAEPVAGWTAYKEYLQKNKKVSEDKKDIHGSVTVSFEVHSKWINNFSIEQSLDEDLDAEAIRLVKEGPAWKLLKGKKASATVIVKF